MTKELEALDFIKNIIEELQYYNRSVKIDNSIYDLFDTVEIALKLLEQIDNLFKEYDIKPTEIREAFIFYKMKQNTNSSKELEALNEVRENLDLEGCLDFINEKRITDIKQALQRLESIDNTNPSEALECLEKVELLTCDFEWYKDNINTIKQALLKAQEQEKVLKIIKEKNVNTLLLELAENLEEYNERIVPNGKLTEEEFDTLKRYFENE